jgi:branched-chain amino acid transport system permease protein
LATDIILLGLLAMAYNFAFGQAGMVSFGHGIFFGVSAYVAGILMVLWRPSIWCLIPGIAAGAGLAFIVGWICFKRIDPRAHPVYGMVFFVLITIAFTYIVYYIFLSPLKHYSGGEQGLTGIGRELNIIGPWSISLRSRFTVHLFVTLFAVASILTIRALIRSSLGRLARAIKENELRVMFLGFNTFRSRVLIFTISGFFSAVAGALYLVRLGFVGLEVFSIFFVGDVLVMCLIGGRTSIYGPLVGAAIFVAMKDFISGYTNAWMLIVSVILVAIVMFLPNGILQTGRRLR